jgi:dTDP-4-dehydrorhamnose 3,5-epimerase
MKFTELNLSGALEISPEPYLDARGEFLRMFCFDTFSAKKLNTNWLQQNISKNPYCGTIRGSHFQMGKSAEVKLVSCIRGAVLDLIIDLRPHSETFGQSCGVTLTSTLGNSIYVPKGFGHGYLTLEDNSEVMYLASENYSQKAESGINILKSSLTLFDSNSVKKISDRDLCLPSFEEFVATIGSDPLWYQTDLNSYQE